MSALGGSGRAASKEEVRVCDGFRMPASDSGATCTRGRRPKAAKERTRGRWCAESAAHSEEGVCDGSKWARGAIDEGSGGRQSGKHRLAFVAFDSAKDKHAVPSLTTVAAGKCAIWHGSRICP